MNGVGTTFNPDGSSFLGKFDSGEKNGLGRYTSNLGIPEKQEWLKGQRIDYVISTDEK